MYFNILINLGIIVGVMSTSSLAIMFRLYFDDVITSDPIDQTFIGQEVSALLAAYHQKCLVFVEHTVALKQTFQVCDCLNGSGDEDFEVL